ncbi:MAG: HAD family hydrolase [Candidatus Nanoarchaeia archaeon]
MKEAAVFDVDKTIIKGNTGIIFTIIFLKKGYLSLWEFLKIIYYAVMYKLHRFDYEKGMRSVYSTLKNHNRQELLKIINYSYSEHIEPKIYDFMKKEIEMHKNKGRVIIFATNSMKEMVDKLAEGLRADFLLSTTAEHKNKKFTGRIKNICYGKEKAAQVKKFCQKKGLKITHAYSDHYSDRHLLMLAQNPVAVKPDKKLKKFAESRNWKVIR